MRANSNHLGREEIFYAFAAADEARLVAFDEDFCGARTGVVVGALRHAVCTGIKQGHQVAGVYGREFAVTRKKVA
jgi:hypothetical protein